MKRLRLVMVFVYLLASALQGQNAASLRGVVTDPSGAVVPGALVQLRGPGGEKRATTDGAGSYDFASLNPGKYLVRVIAKGFTITEKRGFDIAGRAAMDVQLTIQVETQVVNVEEAANAISADPDSNGTALVLGEKELETLSDDPDELQQQLQAMAGPAAGPNGGQIYIDGFTGGTLPPKSSIREVRINSNPFSPEFDRPGFGRIQIFTKPGSDSFHGQVFAQFNKEALNSRSPLLAQAKRPPYQQKFAGVNVSGPVVKQKASFGFDLERRNIDENAFILATDLDSNLNSRTVNQAILTPQTRTSFAPRVDYTINSKNTLTVRYQNTRMAMDNEGVGSFSLASKAYTQADLEQSVQMTETAVLSAKMTHETRLQFQRSNISMRGDASRPAVSVQGAFDGGGAQVGASGTMLNSWELNNAASLTEGRHMIKFGGRLRQAFLDDTSQRNFGGTYTFFGASGPELDAFNQAIPGTSVQLTALERYRRTLFFGQLGFSAGQIRALGGGASQFSLMAGQPSTSVSQFDLGLFWNDDFRIRPNLTVSYGARYETQTNIHDLSDWSPRVGIAWGIDGGGNKPAKTVLRAGFGTFYDRIAQSLTLQALRYNGVTQNSYLILNPDFFPAIPSADMLAEGRQPQQLQYLYRGLIAPRTYQASVGLDRQINKYARLGFQYVNSRGVHLQRSRNINAPLDGVYPFGDSQLRMLTETTGFSRTSQLMVMPNVNYKKLLLFGFYSYSHGKSDAEGTPADPYNLRAEWGPSSYADIRHRVMFGTNLPLLWKLSVSPFFMASSGQPYNLTTGHDTNGDGLTSERPALLTNVSAANCQGGSLRYAAAFGCFDLAPGPGAATIGRNLGRGPGNVNLGLRLARTWSFGSKGESGAGHFGPPPGIGGGRGGGPPGGGPPPGARMGGGPGGPGGFFGGASGKKYNLTLSIFARNVLNHVNWAPPSGDLSSPYFGEYRSLAGFGPFGGNTTYNRKIDVQLRFMF